MSMQPLWYIKQKLGEDFWEWKLEKKDDRHVCFDDIIEFLIQKNILGGRRFNDYIDNMPDLDAIDYMEKRPPLREGFIPPGAWFGKSKRGDKDG